MHVIQLSTIHRRAVSWYDRPIVITIKKSTLVIWALLLVILWLLVRPVHAIPLDSSSATIKQSAQAASSAGPDKPTTTIVSAASTLPSLGDKGGFSVAPINRFNDIQKQIDDKKAADAQAIVDAQNAAQAAVATQQAQAATDLAQLVQSPLEPVSTSGCTTYWSGDVYLDNIIRYESGGNSCAENPGGCWGLLQACPGDPLKQACGGDPSCQIAWFIANKTGGRSWAEVWQHELDFGWW